MEREGGDLAFIAALWLSEGVRRERQYTREVWGFFVPLLCPLLEGFNAGLLFLVCCRNDVSGLVLFACGVAVVVIGPDLYEYLFMQVLVFKMQVQVPA